MSKQQMPFEKRFAEALKRARRIQQEADRLGLGAARRIQQEADRLGLGATGRFPEGKLNEDDEGELKAAVAIVNDQIVINFGKPVAWVSMPPEQALMIAETIRQKAAALMDRLESDKQ